jgi:hypothetical protein
LCDAAIPQVLEDCACGSDGYLPTDPTVPCDPQCDLASHLTVDLAAQTAFLTDTNWQGGLNNNKQGSSW